MNIIKTWWAGMKNKKTITIVTVVVIVAIILGWWWVASSRRAAPVFAPTGQVVAGFPKELILDPAAQVSGSYSVNYSSNLNQYTASWTSTSSIDDLYNQYLNYFSSRGWAIINSSTAIDGFRGIYAVTSTIDANVVMNSESGGLNVTISYVKKALMQSAQAATVAPPVSTNAPATVTIQNAKITKQEGNVFTVDFDIANQLGAQPTIKYGVSLIQLKGASQFVVDTKVYGDTVSLGANDSKHISVTYTAPAFLQGSYFLGIQAENGAGLSLGMAPLGSVTLQGSGAYVNINEASCYLTVPQDVQATEYNIGQGVDTLPSEDLIAHCDVTNMFGKNVTVTPSFATYYRSVFGAFVASTTQNQITIPSGGAAPESFTVSKAKDPQAYETVLTLLDAQGNPISNSINIDYVVHGESATIQNVVFDKNSYQAGDTAKLSLLWSGPATSFKPRIAAASEGSLTADVQITNAQGASCANSYSQSLGSTGGKAVLNIPITAQCTNPTAKVALSDAAGNVLASNSFSVESGSGQASGSGLSEAWIYATGLLILIIIAAYFLMKKKKTSSNGGNLIKVLGLLIVIGASAIVIHAVPASAACPAGGCNNIVCSPNATRACTSATNSCGMTNSGTEACLPGGSGWDICRDSSGNAITAPSNSSCPSVTPVFTPPLPSTGATQSCTTAANSCGMTNQGTETYGGIDVGWSSCGPVPSNSLCIWCTPGATQTCISAPNNTCDLVYAGSETCQANGTWGACNAQVPPETACETNCGVNVAPGTPGQTCISQPNSCGMTNAGVEKCLNNAGKLSPCNIPSTPPSNSECTYQPPGAPTFTLGLNVTLDKTQYTSGAPITVNATFNGLYINGQIVLDTSSFILNGTISGVTAPVLDGAGGIGGGLYFDDPNNPAYLGYNSTYPQYPGLITGTVSSPTWENVAAPGLQPNMEEVNVVTDVAYPISNTVTFTAPTTPGSYNAVFTADGNDGFWDKSETVTIPYTVVGPPDTLPDTLNVYSYLTGGSAMVPAEWNIFGPQQYNASSPATTATYTDVPTGTYTLSTTTSPANVYLRSVYSAVNIMPTYPLALMSSPSTPLAIKPDYASQALVDAFGVTKAYAMRLIAAPPPETCTPDQKSSCSATNSCGMSNTGIQICDATGRDWSACLSSYPSGPDLTAPPESSCPASYFNTPSLTLSNGDTGNFVIVWDPLPVMSLNETAVTLNATNNFSDNSLVVTNVGSSTSVLNWTASSNQSWLTVSSLNGTLSSGVSGGNLTLSANISGLTPETTYNATVTFSGAAANTNALPQPSVPSKSVTVTLVVPSLPVVTLTASPKTITAGQSASLSWTSQYTTGQCTASDSTNGSSLPGGSYANSWDGTHTNNGLQSLNGTLSISPSQTTTFTLTCSNAAGLSASNSVTVTVAPPPLIASLSANPSSGPSPLTTTLTAQASGGLVGATYNFTFWKDCSYTGNSVSVATDVCGNPPLRADRGISANTDTAVVTYFGGTFRPIVIIENGSQAAWAGTSVTTTVAPPPSVKLTASPSSVTLGSPTTLTWSSTNTNSCTASDSIGAKYSSPQNAWDGENGNNSGSQQTSGFLLITPNATGNITYTLTCTGAGGTQFASATVAVSAAQSCPAAPSTSPLSVQLSTFPSSGSAPLSTMLIAIASGGSDGGTYNFTFWPSCQYTAAGVPTVATAESPSQCGTSGEIKHDNVTAEANTAAVTYPSAGSEYPFVIVEHGSGTGDDTTVKAGAMVSVTSQPSTQHYACSGNSCVASASGSYTSSNCNSACSSPSEHLACVNNACAEVSGGGGNQDGCATTGASCGGGGNNVCTPNATTTCYSSANNCGAQNSALQTCLSDGSGWGVCPVANNPPPNGSCAIGGYNCINNNACEWSPSGVASESSCAATCFPPPPPPQHYACSDNSCVASASGSYTSPDCNGVCSPPPPVTINSFTASPTTIIVPESATFSWTSSGASSCSISPTPKVGTVLINSSLLKPVSDSPTATTAYTLTCTNGTYSTQKSLTVTVSSLGQKEINP